MRQSCIKAIGLSLALSASGTLYAQQPGSPLTILLDQAQNALNDLSYGKADSLARDVYTNVRASKTQMERARLIRAAAAYPDDTPDHQKPNNALVFLKEAVRANLDVALTADISWKGLDSLMTVAKKTTMGIAFRADSSQTVKGAGTAEFRIRASKKTTVIMTVAAAAGGATLAADTATADSVVVLKFATMKDAKVALPTGDYVLTFLARDAATGDTMSTKQAIRITAPPLDLTAPPTTIDKSKLLPERSKKYGFGGVFSALWIGAGAYAISTYMVIDSVPTQSKTFSPDTKGKTIGIGLGTAVLLASILDPGRPLKGNIEANLALNGDLAKSIAANTAANAEKVANYQVTVVLTPGGPR